MTVHLNLAGYLFADLDELPSLRQRIFDAGERLHVRGTVLLAPEGINLVVCGEPGGARQWLDAVREDARLRPLQCKESVSQRMEFGRWRVKIKPEIISFRQGPIRPQDGRAASVDAPTLRRWLEQGHDDALRPIRLLDTRNAFEVQAGSFEQASHLSIASFTQFAAALQRQQDIGKDERIVTFCTGGIRCEKAALYMQAQGYRDVLQLEGGVLKYFEEVGSAHWRGDLFVFDQRETLAPDLKPSAASTSSASAQAPAGQSPAGQSPAGVAA